jgi:hypothetical protein
MNRNVRTGILPLILAALLLASACEKKKAPQVEEVAAPAEHVSPSPVGTRQMILHKTFPIKTSAIFPFEVPAHAVMPHLQGHYKSYIGQVSVQSTDESANVDFFILNEEQHVDFVRGTPSETLFSAATSHDQDVSVSLPGSQGLSVKYYLVFRTTPTTEKKVVQADFTMDF